MSYEGVQGFKNCKIGILDDCQVNKLEWKNRFWAIEETLETYWLHNNEEEEMVVSQWLHGPISCCDSF